MPLNKNDLKEINNLLDSKFKDKFAEQDSKIDTKFTEQDAKIDAKFAEQDARIDAKFAEQDAKIDAKFAEQDTRIDKKFANMMKFCLDTFVTKIEFGELKKQVAMLPTREEFFSRMDSLAAMLERHDMERVSLGNRVERIDVRLNRVENLPEIATQLS